MKKVIIERPRVGGGFCKPPQLYIDPKRVDEDFDAGPGRESLTKKMGWDMKSQTDVLGPLKKFLQSNLGRRWDDVWSEICEHNKDWMGDHLKRHVGYMVETDVRITEQRDLTDNAGFHFDGFYVDPETGKLEKKERQRWRYKPRPQTIFHLNGTDYYKYDGIWYRVVVKEWKREPADRYARHYHGGMTCLGTADSTTTTLVVGTSLDACLQQIGSMQKQTTSQLKGMQAAERHG
jgi:hypothetical protein